MQIGNTANQLTNTRRKYASPHGGLPPPLPLCYQWVKSLTSLTLIKPHGYKKEQCWTVQTSNLIPNEVATPVADVLLKVIFVKDVKD